MHPLLQAPEAFPLFPDPCANKHKGNQHSKEAFKRVNVGSQNQRILALYSDGSKLTPKEVAARMGVPLHTVSGRFSFLKGRYLKPTGAEREGSGELELIAAG